MNVILAASFLTLTRLQYFRPIISSNYLFMKKILGFAVLALAFTACHNSGNENRATTTAPATPSFSAPITTVKADSSKQQPINNTPAVSPAPANTNTAALNPKHGMPGHRCDIPEGAPLNSAPISTSIPANASPANPTVIQPPAPAGKTVKLNPPHGQPGHDCAVAVGQPLKS